MRVWMEGLEFFNVAELEKRQGLPGWILHRFPEAVRGAVRGEVADLCRSVEIRYLSGEGRGSRIYLMARDTDAQAAVFFGEYAAGAVVPLPRGVIVPVPTDFPPALAGMPRGRYANNLCRVFLNSRSQVSFVGAEHLNILPRERGDAPEKVILCHGSSITHGGLAVSNYNCFVQHAARRLGVDALNWGMSGACLMEREMAAHIAAQKGLCALTLELGANVMQLPPAVFREKAEFMINTVASAHVKTPVFVLTMLPRGSRSEHFEAFNEALHGICSAAPGNVVLLEGGDLLPDRTGLTSDLIHPSDWGHMLAGENLARLMAPFLS